ncbi:MAG TPA: FAD-dependent monooxygenase [Burkholderiales bacterium]|nr:FAD-dependent monooxygenase [Burkholderiales bacterium]
MSASGADTDTDADVLVLGCGPAGAATAIGLARLGYRVIAAGEPRRFRAVEGISERVLAGLRNAGFERALAAVHEPSARSAIWNGVSGSVNTERLVDRECFDRGLLDDLARNGVRTVAARVARCGRDAGCHLAELEKSDGPRTLRARFLVEARGRAAPSDRSRVRGAETVSLLQGWRGTPADAASAVESFDDGWAWMARMPDGERWLQLTLDATNAGLPPKHALADWCVQRLRALAASASFLRDAAPSAELHARASTPVLAGEAVGDDWIRVGDAAMAVDPLSGNGIFQAISSALQAPAVVNTLLRRPQAGELAKAFHRARIEGLFYRFARIGRDFYAQESRWPARSFWTVRRAWPDEEPVHRPFAPAEVWITQRPVVNDAYIEEAEVVVTPDEPGGIWRVDNLPAAELLRAARNSNGVPLEHALAPLLGNNPQRAAAAAAWMREAGWIARE